MLVICTTLFFCSKYADGCIPTQNVEGEYRNPVSPITSVPYVTTVPPTTTTTQVTSTTTTTTTTTTTAPPIASPCTGCLDVYSSSCLGNNAAATCATRSQAGVTYTVGPVYYQYSVVGDSDTCSTSFYCPSGSRYRARASPSGSISAGTANIEVVATCQQSTGANPRTWFLRNNGPTEIDALTCQYD